MGATESDTPWEIGLREYLYFFFVFKEFPIILQNQNFLMAADLIENYTVQSILN